LRAANTSTTLAAKADVLNVPSTQAIEQTGLNVVFVSRLARRLQDLDDMSAVVA